MSVRILSKVWDGFPGNGSDLLAMLALADWSDDEGRCWPSIPAIARKVRLSPDQARRVVHRLINGDFVRVTAGKTGGGMSRRYQINLDALTPCMDATPSTGARGCMDASPPLASAPGDPLHSYASRTVIDTSVTHQSPQQPELLAVGQADGPDLFSLFWDAYPKKVAKQEAQRAWRKLKLPAGTINILMAALEAAKASAQWQKDQGQYIPYPATWLNGRRWEDAQGERQDHGKVALPDFAAGAI